MTGYVNPPGRIPFLLRLAIWIAEKVTRATLLPARILSWYPKAAVGAGVMEGLVAHEAGAATARLLKLVRMQVSFKASCPFCIDMNAFRFESLNITAEEIEALQDTRRLEEVATFDEKERAALRYARALTETPIEIGEALLREMLRNFTEREFVVIVSTIAQVNFWTRTIQGLGVPPAGFMPQCTVLRLEKYRTLKREE